MIGASRIGFLFLLLGISSHGFQPLLGRGSLSLATAASPFVVVPRTSETGKSFSKTWLNRHRNHRQYNNYLSNRKTGGSIQSAASSSSSEDEKPPTFTNTETKFPTHLLPDKSISALGGIVLLDIFFRQLMQTLNLSFPSSLAGCGALFATFLLAPGGAQLHKLLSPGAALLAKWLPVFFVPSLITLPLAVGPGSISELLKVALVVVGGFFFTLLTTAWTVVGVRKMMPYGPQDYVPPPTIPEPDEPQDIATTKPKTPKPFSDELNKRLQISVAGTAVVAVIASQIGGSLATPFKSLFMLSVTLASFVFGSRLPRKFVKVVHPLITCSTLTWTAAFLFAKLIGKSFLKIVKEYRTSRLTFARAGAGDLLLFLLGPAVVSLACQMYDRRRLMKENIAEVGAAVTVSAFGGVFGTAAAVRLLDLASPYIRLSLLSRNITSPLAMAIASILGADASFAVSIVVITGLIGANFGAAILDRFKITDPVARGLGVGAAAHGLGTAAIVKEEDAFPFAAIAMALTASATTVIVSIPLFKRIILQLALGA